MWSVEVVGVLVLAMSSTKKESFSSEGPRPLSTALSTCAILSETVFLSGLAEDLLR